MMIQFSAPCMRYQSQWIDTVHTTALQKCECKKHIAFTLRLRNTNNANIDNIIVMNDSLANLFLQVWCASIMI